MKGLENKIPPPAVALLVATAMWGLAEATPNMPVDNTTRLALVALCYLLGAGFSLGGVMSFRRAKTTFSSYKSNVFGMGNQRFRDAKATFPEGKINVFGRPFGRNVFGRQHQRFRYIKTKFSECKINVCGRQNQRLRDAKSTFLGGKIHVFGMRN